MYLTSKVYRGFRDRKVVRRELEIRRQIKRGMSLDTKINMGSTNVRGCLIIFIQLW